MEVNKMARAMDVADEIITIASKQGSPVSNLMLQKVMYFLNALSLVNQGNPLINDGQRFEKWDYGPVIHSVYTEYSDNGRNLIRTPKVHDFFERDKEGKLKIKHRVFNSQNLSTNEKTFIMQNINVFLKYDPFELVDWSHEEPQWKNKSPYFYDNQETRNYYSIKSNRFWEWNS